MQSSSKKQALLQINRHLPASLVIRLAKGALTARTEIEKHLMRRRGTLQGRHSKTTAS